MQEGRGSALATPRPPHEWGVSFTRSTPSPLNGSPSTPHPNARLQIFPKTNLFINSAFLINFKHKARQHTLWLFALVYTGSYRSQDLWGDNCTTPFPTAVVSKNLPWWVERAWTDLNILWVGWNSKLVRLRRAGNLRKHRNPQFCLKVFLCALIFWSRLAFFLGLLSLFLKVAATFFLRLPLLTAKVEFGFSQRDLPQLCDSKPRPPTHIPAHKHHRRAGNCRKMQMIVIRF